MRRYSGRGSYLKRGKHFFKGQRYRKRRARNDSKYGFWR